jgi:hypothetical protein
MGCLRAPPPTGPMSWSIDDRRAQIYTSGVAKKSDLVPDWYLIAEISVYGRPTSCNPSLPRKREPRAVFGVLALGARFRGHDGDVGSCQTSRAATVPGWPGLA